MKRIESVKLSGLNGERVDVVTFARWKKKIAGIEFDFALHLLPSFKVGLPNKLWISELGTGFNTLVVVKHPVTGQHMTDVWADKLGQGYVVKLAKAALHNRLKECGDSAFVDGLVRAEILLSKQQRERARREQKFDCDFCEDTRMQAESGPEGALLAVACKMCADQPVKPSPTQEEERLSHNILEAGELRVIECDTCMDSKVVSTTDKDHEGNNIEISCPVCVEKNGGLKSGGVGFRFDIPMTPGDPSAEEYTPSPEEVAAALEDAGTMASNMAKYGTIDAPTLEKLWERRNYLQERTDQHSTMTGDTTEQEYETLTEELADIDKQIHDLENPPCSK